MRIRFEAIKKFILPPGPILSLTLIGLLLLGAVIYYRAIKIQRFLEPALAFSQPRLKFSQSINTLLEKEFGSHETRGIRFRMGSILVDQSLIFPNGRVTDPADSVVLKRLGHFFLSALSDPAIRENISMVLVTTRVPLTDDPGMNRMLRIQLQAKTLFILNELFSAEPQIERNYAKYFGATAVSIDVPFQETNWVEFRIIPAERFHIELLQRLQKYMK